MTARLELSHIDDSFVSGLDREDLGISIRILCPDGTSEVHDLDWAGFDYIDAVADRAIEVDDALRLAQLTPDERTAFDRPVYTDEECQLNHSLCEEDWCLYNDAHQVFFLHLTRRRGVIVDWQWFAGAMPVGPPGSAVPTDDNRHVDEGSGSLATEIEATREW